MINSDCKSLETSGSRITGDHSIRARGKSEVVCGIIQLKNCSAWLHSPLIDLRCLGKRRSAKGTHYVVYISLYGLSSRRGRMP